MVKHLVGRALLDDHAAFHKDHTVGDLTTVVGRVVFYFVIQ